MCVNIGRTENKRNRYERRIKEEPRVRVIYRMGNARKCGPIRDVEKEGKQRNKHENAREM